MKAFFSHLAVSLSDSVDKITLPKQVIFAFVSSSFLSTVHIVLGILIALINISILIPVAIKTWKKKDKD